MRKLSINITILYAFSNKLSFAKLFYLWKIVSLIINAVSSIISKLAQPKKIILVINMFIFKLINLFSCKTFVNTLKTTQPIVIDKIIQNLLMAEITKWLTIVKVITFELAICDILSNCHLIEKFLFLSNPSFYGLPH